MSKLVKALNGDETAEGWDNMDSGSLSAAAKDDWSKNVAEKLEPAIAAVRGNFCLARCGWNER